MVPYLEMLTLSEKYKGKKVLMPHNPEAKTKILRKTPNQLLIKKLKDEIKNIFFY